MRLPAKSAGARQGAAAQPTPLPRTKALTRLGRRLRASEGFTIVEVMVAAVVLVVGLGAVLSMLVTADHVISTTRYRQEETSIAREVLEDARNLPYTQVIQSSLASSLQSSVPNSTLSGSTLVVKRYLSPSTSGQVNFDVTFTSCSLDSPSDGYGNHDSAPLSGGSWCPDTAANATTDSNPDDFKRVSVTVTPETRTTPTVQQTVLVYQRPVNGPAVSCLSTTSTCPGVNVTTTNGSSLNFNVTTTATASRIQWLVNGNPPASNQIGGGGVDPYAPSSTSSSFTWKYPTTTFGGNTYTIDGTYTITAVAYDSDGNSGTRSTVQVTLNQHTVLPPSSITAGWNDLMQGVDIQWLPSVDQDVLYYTVYHTWNGVTTQVTTCGTSGQVNGTSCTDTAALLNAQNPPIPSLRPTCTNPGQSYTTSNTYYVLGWDKDPSTGSARQSTFSHLTSDANLCNHQPNAPSSLVATASGSTIQLSWTAPSPGDPDTGDSIQDWRIYRWNATGSMSDPGSRYQLIGTSTSSPVTSYTDTAPDPGGVTQSYCVTSVDTRLNESSCSNAVTG
jgi:Tfp pilus assembly protein PilV